MDPNIVLSEKRIMVLDTEYDTNPKRLLALAYIIYNQEDNKKTISYIKYPENVFKVNESGEAFKYHKLTNKYLEEHGIDIKDAMQTFYNDLLNVDIVIGQNIISADIQAIRKEAIGCYLWYDKIKEKLKDIPIYDTMFAFREKNPEIKSSLDSIYNHLFDKEMKNHHNALDDCKNTFKCFKKMFENNYKFDKQIVKFSEDIFEELTKETKKCDVCESKISEGHNVYKFINKFNVFSSEGKSHSINNNIIKENQEICKRCLGHLELLILNQDNNLIDLVKFKNYDTCLKDFFQVIGEEPISVYLESDYKDKDEIKKLGGRWDGRKKSWYFTYTVGTESNVNKFKKWIVNTN